jgi:hypothetical protein
MTEPTLADPQRLVPPGDPQRLEFVGFLSRLATDMDCPDDLALDLFGATYQDVVAAGPLTVAQLRGLHELVWDVLERIGYLPRSEVLERA